MATGKAQPLKEEIYLLSPDLVSGFRISVCGFDPGFRVRIFYILENHGENADIKYIKALSISTIKNPK
jgi:hypothetical protein